MATPHVAGIAAVEAVKLAKSGRFTAQELRQSVLANTTPIPALSKADVGRGKVVDR
jgi:hypothetical protein